MTDDELDDTDPEDWTHIDDDFLSKDGLPRGSREPQDGRCNALVTHWRKYGHPRYCGRLTMDKFEDATDHDTDHGYCWVHRNRKGLDMRAEELLQHGISSKTRDTMYGNLPAVERVMVHGIHESLMGNSIYEFGVEYTEQTFDFSDADVDITVPGQSGPEYEIEVAHATDYIDRELALWCASIDSMKLLKAQEMVWREDMRTESTVEADYTTNKVTGEDGAGTPKSWQTIEEYKEHYLNLPISRLTRDRKELLMYGGVEVDGQTSDDSSVIEGIESLTMDLNADPERTDDPSPVHEKATEAGLKDE